MSKWFALLLACMLFPGMASAQDELVKDFTSAQLEKFIKDVMKIEAKKTEFPKEKFIGYATPNGFFDVNFSTDPDNKAITFIYRFATRKAPLEKVNEWNARGYYLTAYLEKEDKLAVRAYVNLEAGLSHGQLANYYQRIDRERKAFEDFTAPAEKKKSDGQPDNGK